MPDSVVYSKTAFLESSLAGFGYPFSDAITETFELFSKLKRPWGFPLRVYLKCQSIVFTDALCPHVLCISTFGRGADVGLQGFYPDTEQLNRSQCDLEH
jgi:hypothetical protein